MSIKETLADLEDLVSPNKDEKKPMNGVFFEKYEKHKPGRDFIKICEGNLFLSSPFTNEPWWSFHVLTLDKLLQLKSLLASADEKESLLSVAQQKTVKAALEITTVLGVVYNLPKGIGITLKLRSTLERNFSIESSPEQKCYSLCLTVECLMMLREHITFKDVIARYQLGDLLAALFTVFFPPEGYQVPSDFRFKAKQYLETLVSKEFQPNVIKELLLLHGNPNCPSKVARAFRGYLTDRLMQRVGVVATIKAILDITQGLSSPQHWKNVNTLSKLIVTPHIKDVEQYRAKVYPQISQLLYANEIEFAQVAVACVRQIHEKDPNSCREWFINQLTAPFLSPAAEEEISQCIEGLHNCCGVPCSENWSLPLSAVEEIHANLFRLHCKINSSVYRLKSKVADIVSAIVKQGDPKKTYDRFLFHEEYLLFEFTDSGGVASKLGGNQTDWETASDNFLTILGTLNSAELKYEYFKVALESMIEEDFEKKLLAGKILSEIASDENVQEFVNRNPAPIIKFVSNLLETGDDDVEIACLGLMVISAMLENPARKFTTDWNAFKILAEPLKAFQNRSSNVEVKLLAEELRSTILSRGVITSKEAKKVEDKCNVERAMAEAVDRLIPVRAHGLMSLTKSIVKKEAGVDSKKDVLLCLFKENLKEDDTYVYLAAVEGVAALAANYPDEVLTVLTEQYRHAKNTEVRLKIGESLMKVVRNLNEMAYVYKGELICAFLAACLDSDHLVRASSLSNMGELCKILGFRIQAYLVDVLQVLSSVLQTEKSPEPRRAAVMVVTLLLQGLGKDALVTLQDLTLPIYRALKLIVNVEQDDITKLHAQLALEELKSCTMNFLMPGEKMEKRIYVMDPLP